MGPSKTLPKALKRLFCGVFGGLFLLCQQGHGFMPFKKGMGLRDCEIEETLALLGNPLMKKAGQGSGRFYVIYDPTWNAFTTFGGDVFFHSGLLCFCRHPEELLGVMAHEIAHIKGGHVLKLSDQSQVSSGAMIAGILAGAAAALAGCSELALASVSLGQHVGLMQIMAFSRQQESSADHTALRLLRSQKWPTWGLVSFLENMMHHHGIQRDLSPYMKTHPLTWDRIHALKGLKNLQKEASLPTSLRHRFHRMQAKIAGFTMPLEALETKYQCKAYLPYVQKTSSLQKKHLPRAMACALYFARRHHPQKAAFFVRIWSKDFPKDGFLWSLAGDLAWYQGKNQEAQKAYKRAFDLLSLSGISLDYGRALLQHPNHPQEKARQALKVLQCASSQESQNPEYWHLRSLAYGRLGKKAPFYGAMAQKFLCLGDEKKALFYAQKSLEHATKHPSEHHDTKLILAMQDIMAIYGKKTNHSKKSSGMLTSSSEWSPYPDFPKKFLKASTQR